MKKITSRFIAISILISMFLTIMPLSTFAIENNHEVYSAPEQVKGVKGKAELLKYFNEIKRIRDNMNTIIINPETVKENSDSLKTQINSYSTELKSILNSLARYKTVYNDSRADIFVANQIEIIPFILDSSLEQQLLLIDTLVSGEPTNLFFSEYLRSIYYYINVADEMISYLEKFYNLK